MPKAARAALLAVLALLLAACGEVLQGEPAPTRAPDFRPEQVRRPPVLAPPARGPGAGGGGGGGGRGGGGAGGGARGPAGSTLRPPSPARASSAPNTPSWSRSASR